MTDAEREVWDVVREANKARTAGAVREIAALHDPEAVLVRSDGRIEGNDAIARAIEEESHQAHIEAFEELEHSIDVFGDLALVAYSYELRRREAGAGGEEEESGREVLALRRSAGRWKVLWRAQVGESA